jgi:hypothetical protein
MRLTPPIRDLCNPKLWVNNRAVRVRGQVATCHAQFGNGIKFLEFEGDGKKVLGQHLNAIKAYVRNHLSNPSVADRSARHGQNPADSESALATAPFCNRFSSGLPCRLLRGP